MNNYKGIYYNDSKDCKFFEGGAHFRYKDLFYVLLKIGGYLHNEKEKEREKEKEKKETKIEKEIKKEKEKESELNQNKFEINLEDLFHKEQKPKTRNVAQLNYNNNPNTMNSFNIPVAFKSYNSLNKNKIKQSRNAKIGEYFAIDNNSSSNINNYSTSKKNNNKTTNNGFNTNNNDINKQHGRILSNNINLNNNCFDNNEKNNSININININNNYLNYLNNRNKSELNNNKFITKNVLNKKVNVQNAYIKNININKMCSNFKKKHNYVLSYDKNSDVNNNVNNYILKPNNNTNSKNKSMNFVKTDVMNYTKSPGLKTSIKLFNGKYIKTTINKNNIKEKQKLNNCFSLICLGMGNKIKQNNNNNLSIKKNYGENIVLKKYIKKKINQMCFFKNNTKNNININLDGNKGYIKKVASRNLDGVKRIYSNGLKSGTVVDFLYKKHEI